MTVTPSILISSEEEAFLGDLWQPPVFFRANWQDSVRVQTSFPSSSNHGRSAAEQRFLKSKRPVRWLQATTEAWEKRSLLDERMLQFRFGKARSLLPLWSDRTRLTGHLTGNTYSGNFSDRRFFEGGRVLVTIPNNDTYWEDYRICQIAAVSETDITLDCLLEGISFTEEIVEVANSTSAVIPDVTITRRQVLVVLVGAVGGGLTPPTHSVTWAGSAMTKQTDVDATGPRLRATIWTVHDEVGKGDVIVTLTAPATKIWMQVLVCDNVDTDNPIAHTMEGSWVDSDPRNPVTVSAVHQKVLYGAASTIDDITSATHTVINLFEDGTQSALFQYHDATSADVGIGAINAGFDGGVAGDSTVTNAVVLNPSLDYARGYIYPLVECDVLLQSDSAVITDTKEQFVIQGFETPGPSALDALTSPGSAPAGFPTHAGFPVLDLRLLWEGRRGARREGQQTIVGIGTTTDVFGSRSRHQALMPYRFKSRADAFKMLNFFESRGGRVYPFIALSHQYEFDDVGYDGSTLIDVNSAGSFWDWNFLQYLYVLEYSGTLHIAGIVNVTYLGNGIDRIEVDTAIGVTNPDDVRRIGIAFLARFDQHGLIEQWISDEVMETELNVVELLQEKDTSISLDIICEGGSGGWDPDLLCADACIGSLCSLCKNCDLAYEFNHYLIDCPACDTADLIDSGSGIMSFESCTLVNDEVIMKWRDGKDYATLNMDTGEWTPSFSIVGDCALIGFPGQCEDPPCNTLCEDSVSESCTEYHATSTGPSGPLTTTRLTLTGTCHDVS